MAGYEPSKMTNIETLTVFEMKEAIMWLLSQLRKAKVFRVESIREEMKWVFFMTCLYYTSKRGMVEW
ncbi:MAG: hypothetical protein PUD22_05020 [Erysipelotrichaceae bacterium]|nr:hypothetical protein [Erysipelotrichaceae bacterium]